MSGADRATAAGPVVMIGSRVLIRDSSCEDAYRIVAPEDSDPAARSINQDSPLARALLGRRAGDQVTVRSPQPYTVTILHVG